MRHVLLVVMLALLAMGAAAPVAVAHAVLVGSQPPDGTAIARSPGHLRLRFSEDLSPRFRRVHLLDGRGRVVAGTRLRGGGDARELVLEVPRLPRGIYELAWEVLAERDGHVTGGALAFGVATRAPAGARGPGAPGDAGPPLEAALRWLDFALLAALLGGLAMSFSAPAARRMLPRRPGGACSRAAWGGALAFTLGAVLLVREAHALDASLGSLLGVRWGILWLVRETLLTGLAGAALVLLHRPGARTRAIYAVAVALAVALASTRALGAHAASVESGPAVAAHAVHVLGAAVWMGGILALAVALWAARAEAAGLARAIRRPFAWTAGLGVLALAVTGLYSAGAQVASVDALVETFYGRTLLAKTALVLVAGGLGLANAALLRRAAAPRLLIAEAFVGLEIIVAAAVLTSSSPARGPEFAARRTGAGAARRPPGRRRSGRRRRRARTGPAPTSSPCAAVSSRRPPPAAIDRVLLQPEPGRLSRCAGSGPDRWTGGAVLAQPGGVG